MSLEDKPELVILWLRARSSAKQDFLGTVVIENDTQPHLKLPPHLKICSGEPYPFLSTFTLLRVFGIKGIIPNISIY